jgi:hypothetical protein
MSTKSRFVRRSLVLSLVAALIAVMPPTDAYARHTKLKQKNSIAGSFNGPDRFTCDWFEEEGIHQYDCAGANGAFLLIEKLLPSDVPPSNPDVVSDLAIPDKFSCRYTGDPAGERSVELFSCTYRHKHSRHGTMHKHRFLLSAAVLAELEDAPGGEALPNVWVVPHPVKKKADRVGAVADSHSH